MALAAYNGGETNVDHWVTSRHAAHKPLHDRRHPDRTDRAYVTEVLAKQRAYRSHYASQLGYT